MIVDWREFHHETPLILRHPMAIDALQKSGIRPMSSRFVVARDRLRSLRTSPLGWETGGRIFGGPTRNEQGTFQRADEKRLAAISPGGRKSNGLVTVSGRDTRGGNFTELTR
jgi:hypothetical protein